MCHSEELRSNDVRISRKGNRLIKKREIVIEIKIFIIVFVSAKNCGYFCFFEKCFEKGGSFLKITLIFGLISFIFCIRLTD